MNGLLLINLGTPDSPDAQSVKRYLGEFLMDKRVIDIPYLARWLLVNGIILNTRPKKSAEAYQKVWGPMGSPLMHYSKLLKDQVFALRQGPTELAMRYGNPSIKKGLENLLHANCDQIVVFPLYPQWSNATTGSTYAEVMAQAKALGIPSEKLKWVPPFYNDSIFIQTLRDHFKSEFLKLHLNKPVEKVIISFHGLPESQILKADSSKNHCLKIENCCEIQSSTHTFCYRAHCVSTKNDLDFVLKQLGLPSSLIAFQSRLGRAKWLSPDTKSVVEDLARQGYKRIAVACPAFVADCLETLEEIAIQLKETFRTAGGEELLLIPSLNAEPAWAETVVTMANRAEFQPNGPWYQ